MVLEKPENIPILIIETKSTIERGLLKVEELCQSPAKLALGQAFAYAALAMEKHGLPVTLLFDIAKQEYPYAIRLNRTTMEFSNQRICK